MFNSLLHYSGTDGKKKSWLVFFLVVLSVLLAVKKRGTAESAKRRVGEWESGRVGE
jgi:hypothetical protein